MVTSLCFFPDGATLVTGSDDGSVRLWKTGTGQLFKTLRAGATAVDSVALSPNGHLLAAGNYDGSITLWDLSAGDAHRALVGQKGHVNALAFSPEVTPWQARAASRGNRANCFSGTWRPDPSGSR